MSDVTTDPAVSGTSPLSTTPTVPVEALNERADQLAAAIVEALTSTLQATGAAGEELLLGPADVQDGPSDLLPPGQIEGVVASVRDSAVLQVVLVLGEGLLPDLAAAEGDGDPADQSAWMAPVAGAMERWATTVEGVLANALPVDSGSQLDHLIALGQGTALTGAGIFRGSDLVGSIAVVGRTELPPAPAAPAPAAPPTATSTAAPAAAGESGPAVAAMQVLADVEMLVTAELGRTRLNVSDLLGLAPGSVIELDRTAGSPIDLLVNGTLIARGEVVVVDEEYGVRLTEIVGNGEA